MAKLTDVIPERGTTLIEIDGKRQRITNLHKPFWPGITKGDLIRYYVSVSPVLLPHIEGRAMVMRRYPHGAAGEAFFMKNAPSPRPERTDDINRPDYLHFDLDPGAASFEKVIETALFVREALTALKMPAYVKTSGSKGIHVYVPIVRGPTQKEVWTVAKAIATELAARKPQLATAVYQVRQRPKGRVFIDYNQNAWGRTLASIYSARLET